MTRADDIIAAPSRGLARTYSRPTEVAPRRTPVRARPRWSRSRGVVSVFAVFAAFGMIAAYVGPTGAALAEGEAAVSDDTTTSFAVAYDEAQSIALAMESEPAAFDRDGYTVFVEEPEPEPVAVAAAPSTGATWAPPFVVPDPGSAQAIAYSILQSWGWGDDQFACLVALWNKESGWRVNAYNASSGAYGIPQALPGNKMASAGADWETNPTTQIFWGLGYIAGRYGTACGAWAHSQSVGWY